MNSSGSTADSPPSGARSLRAGRVKVNGRRKGRHLQVEDATPVPGPSPAPRPRPGVLRRTLIVLVKVGSDRRETITAEMARQAVFGQGDSASSFMGRQSAQRMGLVGHGGSRGVVGWITAAGANDPCDVNSWSADAERQAAKLAGSDLNSYDHLLFVTNPAPCSWAGMGETPGRRTWYRSDTLNGPVLAHELGHNFGMHHANVYTCASRGAAVVVDRPEQCSSREYADPFDAMGTCFQDHSTYNRVRTGLASSSMARVIAATSPESKASPESEAAGGSRDNARRREPAAVHAGLDVLGSPGGTQLISLPRGRAPAGLDWIHMELRAASPACAMGLPDGGAGGVLLRLGGSAGLAAANRSFLLDANPSNADLG